MKHQVAFLLVGIVALAGGCASQPVEPDWVSGNSSKYPDSRYLIGRGQAASQDQARDRARADLAKVFQVAISEETEDMTNFTRARSKGEQAQDYTASVSRAIRTRTDQVVEGVEIAEQWQAPEGGEHHALAVLNRAKQGARMRAQLNELDDATEAHIQSARASSDLITRIGAAERAVDAQLERRAVQRLLQVIDVTGTGIAPPYNLGKLLDDRDALLKRLRIAPQVTAGSPAELEQHLSSGLAAAGFLHAPGEQAGYVLSGNFQPSSFTDEQGWHWVRGTLAVTLREQAGKSVRGTHRWDIKVSSREHATAQQRARDRIATVLRDDLRSVIISFGQPK
ncbi:MAG: LPP20 family lipoprotein [Pseudomonadota bacterium]|nr:MAG: LPP20 family lipoprotein [Pseudomonadota bacterium]